MQDEVKAYSIAEAAKRLGISYDLLGRIIGRGEIRSMKVGGRRLISSYALTEYVADREFATSKARSERRA